MHKKICTIIRVVQINVTRFENPNRKQKLTDPKMCYFFRFYRFDIIRIEVAPEPVYNQKWENRT